MRETAGVNKKILEKMEALAKISDPLRAQQSVDEFIANISKGGVVTTKNDLLFIRAFIDQPHNNQFLHRMQQLVVGKLKELDLPAKQPTASPAAQSASPAIQSVLLDCDALLKQIEEVMWFPHLPAIKSVLDVNIQELTARPGLDESQKMQVERLQKCAEFWRLMHEVDYLRLNPKSGAKDAVIAPFKQLLDLVQDPVIKSYFEQLNTSGRNTFNVFQKKVCRIAEKIYEAGQKAPHTAGEAERWKNVSDEGRVALRTFGEVLKAVVAKEEPEKSYEKAYDKYNRVVAEKPPRLSTPKTPDYRTPASATTSSGGETVSPTDSSFSANSRRSSEGGTRSTFEQRVADQGVGSLVVKNEKPVEPAYSSDQDKLEGQEIKIMAVAALAAYDKMHHRGQSDSSIAMKTSLYEISQRGELLAKVQLNKALLTKNEADKGIKQSKLISVLFENGLDKIKPDLFVERMGNAITAYIKKSENEKKWPWTSAFKHKALCQEIKKIVEDSTINAETKVKNITGKLQEVDIGKGRLHDFLKENGLELFVEKCAKAPKARLTR